MDDWKEISRWRKQQRPETIERRLAIDPEHRRVWDERITQLIENGFPNLRELVIGFCWPYRGEFDARFAIRHFRDRGATAALPAVVDKKGPLEFRVWRPGVAMTPGVYNIPVPDATPAVLPDAAIVPMNGFDQNGYRLGYGGGYFDRTLASLAPRPISIGVAYEQFRLATIYPQQHDIVMDFVVTEAGIHAVTDRVLMRIDAGEGAARALELQQQRGLPRGQPLAAALGADQQAYSSPPCYAHEIDPGYFGD